MVTILTTPADAFFPKSELCGPLKTSIRSIIGKSEICDWILDLYTPSINTATEGSIPGLFAPLPKPLIKNVEFTDDWYCLVSSDGTTAFKSKRSVIFAFSTVSAVTTDTDTGTSCNVFSSLVAVTITSSTAVEDWE